MRSIVIIVVAGATPNISQHTHECAKSVGVVSSR
jgi:hypothetical protein